MTAKHSKTWWTLVIGLIAIVGFAVAPAVLAAVPSNGGLSGGGYVTPQTAPVAVAAPGFAGQSGETSSLLSLSIAGLPSSYSPSFSSSAASSSSSNSAAASTSVTSSPISITVSPSGAISSPTSSASSPVAASSTSASSTAIAGSALSAVSTPGHSAPSGPCTPVSGPGGVICATITLSPNPATTALIDATTTPGVDQTVEITATGTGGTGT